MVPDGIMSEVDQYALNVHVKNTTRKTKKKCYKQVKNGLKTTGSVSGSMLTYIKRKSGTTQESIGSLLMGKYEVVSCDDWIHNTEQFQNYLIYKTKIDKNNELAESNRLKRIEISMKIITITPKIAGSDALTLRSELEDRA